MTAPAPGAARGSRSVYGDLLLFAGVVVTVAATYLLLRPFLLSIAWAVFLATVTYPLYLRVRDALRGRSGVAALGMTLAVAVCIVGPVLLVGALLVLQAADLAEWARAGGAERLVRDVEASAWFGGIVDTVRGWADRFDVNLEEALRDSVRSVVGPLARATLDLTVQVLVALVSLLLVLFTLFYLYRDGRTLVSHVSALLPLAPADRDRVVAALRSTIFAAVLGGILTALVQATLGAIGFAIVGIPRVVLWGSVMALFALLPLVGAFVVWIPAAVYLAATGHVGKAVFLALWGAIVVGLSDNLLRPHLLRLAGETRIHPLILFFSILGGIGLFGFAGIVLGPLVASAVLVFVELYREREERTAAV